MNTEVVANCRNQDPALWFSTSKRRKAKAVALCNGCGIKQKCLEYALAHKMQYGVWGGLDEDERRELLKPRKQPRVRARPVKRRLPSNLPVPPPSDVRGVSWNAWKGRWIVTIRHGGAMHWVGSFTDQQAAEAAAITKCAELGTSTRRSRTGKKAA